MADVLWVIVGIAAIAAWWIYRHYIKDGAQTLYRLDRGLCKGCGYDLQGSESTCPECGRSFKSHEKVKLRREH